MEPYEDTFSLPELISSSLAQVRIAAERKRIYLNHQDRADAPPLYGDVLRLGQVLINLLSNAVKFTPGLPPWSLRTLLLAPYRSASTPGLLEWTSCAETGHSAC